MAAQPTQASLPITRPSFNEDEIEAIRKVLNSGWVTQGPATAAFEKAFAQRHQVGHALATTSCTAALHMSVLALGIGAGDEVIVPSFTWVTTAHCAEYAGARPVFCDIDPTTLNIDPEALAAAVTPRTRAIVAVHLFGLAVEMQPIMEIAKKHNLAVIEDAACAVGSTYKGRPVGGLGDLGCFSFHPRKVITTGEGGMVTSNNSELAERVAALRNHGANRLKTPADPKPYYMGAFDFLGFNLRLSDIQSAVGLAQMTKLETLLAHRRWCAHRYSEKLADVSWLRVPHESAGCLHSYQSYVVWVRPDAPAPRNAIMDWLGEKGIQTRPGTMAVHTTAYYRDKYNLRPEDYPWSKAAQESTITLPIFPGMTEADLDRVVGSLAAVADWPSARRMAG